MEEKFSVSLELMIEKFKAKAQQTQNIAKNVANKIKENMSVNVGGGAFKEMTAESELLLTKINDIKATLTMASGDAKLFGKSEILDMRVELEKLEKQYDKINGSSNMFGNSFKRIQDGMDKSLKKAKRFTLSLFGIQSVFRMLSRASSAYLAQDTETSSKIQSAWIGLGSIFAPILEKVANFVIKAVKYINVFIKALTGTDFLANAMAKSMNKANKSAGKLSKTLAGFDELTNLDDSTGGASVDTSWIDAFENVELNRDVVIWLENLAKKMKPIVEWIKEAFTWIKENKEMAIGFIIGVGVAFGILSGQWKTKIMALGIGIAIAGIIKFVIELIEWIKNPSWKQFTKVLDGLALAIAGAAAAMIAFNATNPVGWISLAVSAVVGLVSAFGKQVEETEEVIGVTEALRKANEDLKKAKDELRRSTDDYIYAVDRSEEAAKNLLDIEKKLNISGADLQKQVENGTLSYENMNKAQRDVYRAYIDNKNAQDDLKTSKENLTKAQEIEIEKLEEAAEKSSKAYEKWNKDLENLSAAVLRFAGMDYSTTVKVKGDTSDVNNKMNTFWSKLKGIGGSALQLIGLPTNFKIPGFAVGTDYVPNDMIAQIHEGEKIVPKKFNSDEYVKRSDSNNNDALLNKLDELIDRVEQIEINPYTTIKDVGSASVNYINNQNRIMGRGVI